MSYLIISIPDICLLSYFYIKFVFNWSNCFLLNVFEYVDGQLMSDISSAERSKVNLDLWYLFIFIVLLS